MGGNTSSRELKRAITTKETGMGEAMGGTVKYAFSSCQGWRKQMEDAHLAETDIAELQSGSLFAVFDGHGGPGAANFAAANLTQFVKDCYKKQPQLREKTLSQDAKPTAEEHPVAGKVASAIKQALLEIDKHMAANVKMYTGAQDMEDPGSTVITAMVLESQMLFAHLGDARAICCRSGEVVFATKDHKPGDPREEMRIVDAGGFVVSGRVCRCLAVSRALGDHFFKNAELPPEKQMVTAVADLTCIDRDYEKDEFLFIACDGVWDVMSNTAACKFIKNKILEESNLVDVCSAVLDHCLDKGSTDNMTCMLITFPACLTNANVGDTIDDLFAGFGEDEEDSHKADSDDEDYDGTVVAVASDDARKVKGNTPAPIVSSGSGKDKPAASAAPTGAATATPATATAAEVAAAAVRNLAPADDDLDRETDA